MILVTSQSSTMNTVDQSGTCTRAEYVFQLQFQATGILSPNLQGVQEIGHQYSVRLML